MRLESLTLVFTGFLLVAAPAWSNEQASDTTQLLQAPASPAAPGSAGPKTHSENSSSSSADNASFVPQDHIWLMRDFWRLQNTLPNRYRTMNSPFKKKPGVPIPARDGLDDLNASASGIFTNKSLQLIKQRVPQGFKLLVVDLMQESHGFVNGKAVTWYCGRNQINWGKTDEEIRQDENSRLRTLKNQLMATAYGYRSTENPDGLEIGIKPVTFKVKTVQSEEELCHSMGVDYVRIPVADDQPPAQNEVDRFVALIEHLDKKTWLHIHCGAGDGRTTTFLAFLDMMHNARTVTFDDIINRQWLLGGFQLMNGKLSAKWKIPVAKERAKFIQNFYKIWQSKTFPEKSIDSATKHDCFFFTGSSPHFSVSAVSRRPQFGRQLPVSQVSGT